MRKEWIVAIRRDEGDCFKVCSVPVGCVLTLSYCLSHTVMRTSLCNNDKFIGCFN
jgi:hypothetical protein